MVYKTNPLNSQEIVIKEKTHWYLTLSKNQYYLGRATLILKNPSIKHLRELKNEEIKELFEFIKGYEHALEKAFKTTNFNWTCLMNNSYKKSNIENPDPLHLHVWPRYKNRVTFEEVDFHDEVFAHHYDKYKKKKVNQEFLTKLADTILLNWSNTN